MKILMLGGSGFISRYMVNEALDKGHEIYYVTRGNREGIPGAHALICDRNDTDGLRALLRQAGGKFDAVIDCICFTAEQARQDIALFPEFTDRIVVISTDSVYHPEGKRVPQDENGANYMEDDSYGGKKRQMERVFLTECPPALRWTMFRPPHMFGPGSELGCYPTHTRQRDLLAEMRSGAPIRLVEDGKYLIQPLYAGDIAKAVIACIDNPKTYNELFCIAGPEAMPNRTYFEILREILGVPVTFENVPLSEFPEAKEIGYLYFLDRAYDLSKLRDAGLPVPSTSLRDGLRKQVEFLTAQGR